MADAPPPPPAQTVTMYDPATGDPVQVDPGAVGDLYRSGKATFAAGQKVAIRGEDGRVREMSGEEAGAFLGSTEGAIAGGAASQAQLERQGKEDRYGGLGGQLLAGVAGAARSATLGASDAIATGTGLVDPSTLRDLEEVNPNATTAGEVAGMLAPLVVSGGGSAAAQGGGLLSRVAGGAARVATAPARGVMALGRGAEGVAAGLLGESTAARIAAGAAGAAVEGSLYGVGQEISRASIQDVPLTAERIVAAAGHGALLGGAVGGGVSGLGALLRGGAAKAGELGEGLLSKITQHEGQLAGELAESAVPKAENTVNALVDRFGREQALKATGATSGQVERLQAMGREVEDRVVKRLLDDAPEVLGKKPGTILSAAEKAEAATKLAARDGERVGQLMDQLSQAGEKADVAKLVAAQREKLTTEMLSSVSPDAKRAAAQFDEWLTALEQRAGSGDIKELWQARRELRKDIDWKKGVGEGDRANDWKRDLYRDIGTEIQAVGERASPAVGPDFAARWRAANTDYRASLWLEEATAKGAAAEAKNRTFGLSEQLGALAGFAAGGLAGVPLAVGGALVSGLVKRYGSDVAAQLARAATKGEAIHALDQTVERIAGEKVVGLVKTGAGKLREGARTLQQLPDAAPGVATAVEAAVRRQQPADEPRGSITARYKAAAKELQDSLPSRAARLAASTEGLDDVAPGLGAAVRARATAASDFLASKLPRVAQRASLQPHLERERLPTFDEQQRYLRYERAVSDPLSVLDDARRGRLRKEGVEALQAVYPSLYQGLRSQVAAAVAEKSDKLSYQQQLQLGMLFPDLATHPSLNPKAIAAYQAAQHRAPSPFSPPSLAAPSQGSAAPAPHVRPLQLPSMALRSDTLAA